MLASCKYDGNNFGLGKRVDIIKSNSGSITVQYFSNLASPKLVADIISQHCIKYGKYPTTSQHNKGPYQLITSEFKCEKQSISGNKNFVVLKLYGDEIQALPNAEKHCLKYNRSAKYKSKDKFKTIFECVD